ncbi:hypothetical protein SAMN02800694_3720 [Luteibacter sp. UNCMF331Sha3.1]|uniref:MrpH family fimbial adhesin n=1 Tax=Luteibacter sp. UNCMF331Sha3.1 TaxID=1502760 RepID=UPI0008AFB524|nr:hypothetical protein [Luteibacter sp. UNCMF331Sha3.1]SEN55105.1 hypothetical protein SAMN02800694_3720 [Luteibacter sp. UNCMF331Sha3.1]
MNPSTYAIRALSQVAITAMLIVSPCAPASTKTTKVTYGGGVTQITIQWTDDGKDGGTPAEFQYRCNQVGGTPWTIKFWFDGKGQDATPELNLYPNLAPWPYTCDGRGTFQGVVELYQNPFTIIIPGDVRGKTLCYGARNGHSGNWGQFTNQTCTTVSPPLPELRCTISVSDVAFPFGNVTVAAVNGRVATTSLSVSCNRPALGKVMAVASAGNPTSLIPVRADGTIKSQLKVDGYPTEHDISVDGTNALPVTLTATLSATAPTAGSLQGNAVFILKMVPRP